MKLSQLFTRTKRRAPAAPQPRDWTTTWTPRDWADLPVHHPRNERDAT